MKATKTILFCTLLIMTFSGWANADITISQYRERKDTSDMKAHIWGIQNAFGWANARLKLQNKQPLYCEPAKVTMTFEDLTFMIDEEAASLDKQGKLKPDTAIALLLLLRLQEKFPCQA